jgi:hypothetical protein
MQPILSKSRSVERKVDITNLCPNPVQKSDIFAYYELLIASNLNKQPTRSDFCKVLPSRFNTSGLNLLYPYKYIKKLQEDAQEAFSRRNLDFAEQLCIRANEAAQGQNKSILDLLNQIQRNRLEVNALELPPLSLNRIVGEFNELRDSRSAQLSEFTKQASQAVTNRLHGQYLGFRGFLTPKIQAFGRAFTNISALNRKKAPGCLGLVGLSFLGLTVFRDIPRNRTSPQSNYLALESVLKSGDWIAADQETVNLILQNIGKPSLISLVPGDVNQVPCEVLGDIDRLWMQNSAGKFGFSVQKRVFSDIEKFAPTLDRNAILSAFNTQVGWSSNEIWGADSRPIAPGELPAGHFPKTSFRVGFSSFIQKLSTRSVERKVDITNLCPNPVQKSDIFAHYELLIASNLNKQPARSDFCKVLPARFNTSGFLPVSFDLRKLISQVLP